MKYTPDDSPDKTDIPKVIDMIKTFLTKVNIESGKSENIFELAQLEQQLVFRPNESIVSKDLFRDVKLLIGRTCV